MIVRLFDNKVLRKIFGAKWEKVSEDWRKLHNRNFIILNLYQILFQEREHFKVLGIDRVVLNWILNEWNGITRSGFVWFSVGAGGGLF
jgi:hypothetical protein